MKHNNDFRYDLKVGQVAESILANLLQTKTIEVKRDLRALDTGNVFVEYESRNKASGIAKSEADYYCYFISDTRMFLITTEDLKALCRKYIGTYRDKLGGDSNTSKGILLPIIDLINEV
tara:strand:+ start:256 stop:612 length:357 start_codon:yes stop_codon:yes gene_type:complete